MSYPVIWKEDWKAESSALSLWSYWRIRTQFWADLIHWIFWIAQSLRCLCFGSEVQI